MNGYKFPLQMYTNILFYYVFKKTNYSIGVLSFGFVYATCDWALSVSEPKTLFTVSCSFVISVLVYWCIGILIFGHLSSVASAMLRLSLSNHRSVHRFFLRSLVIFSFLFFILFCV